MNSRRRVLLYLYLACLGPVMARDENWRVLIAYDPLQQKTACLMESKSMKVFDGQTDTPLQLVYNGRVLRMTSQPHVDLSYPGVGLRVDGQEPFAVDVVEHRTDLIFSSRADTIKAQFIAGRQAQIAVGFWPTWPRSDTVLSPASTWLDFPWRTVRSGTARARANCRVTTSVFED